MSKKKDNVWQAMYENRVMNDRIYFFKFMLFYLAKEEIQSWRIYRVFPLSFLLDFLIQIKKKSFSTLFLYILISPLPPYTIQRHQLKD